MTQQTTLSLTKMHCASCAQLIERQLNKTPGVEKASVNYGTERAHVIHDQSQATIDKLIQRVQEIGYDASELKDDGQARQSEDMARAKEISSVKVKFIISVLLALPVLILS